MKRFMVGLAACVFAMLVGQNAFAGAPHGGGAHHGGGGVSHGHGGYVPHGGGGVPHGGYVPHGGGVPHGGYVPHGGGVPHGGYVPHGGGVPHGGYVPHYNPRPNWNGYHGVRQGYHYNPYCHVPGYYRVPPYGWRYGVDIYVGVGIRPIWSPIYGVWYWVDEFGNVYYWYSWQY